MAKILVVDDEVEISTIISEFLATAGHQVFSSNTPEEVLALVARERPDLIVTDFNMPRLTGTELLAKLRLAPATKRLPVIFVSGTDPLRFAKLAPPEPWIRFLSKPPHFPQLKTTIDELLNPDGWSAQLDPDPDA